MKSDDANLSDSAFIVIQYAEPRYALPFANTEAIYQLKKPTDLGLHWLSLSLKKTPDQDLHSLSLSM